MRAEPARRPLLGVALALAAGDALGKGLEPGPALALLASSWALAGARAGGTFRGPAGPRLLLLLLATLATVRADVQARLVAPGTSATGVVAQRGFGGRVVERAGAAPWVIPEGIARAGEVVRACSPPRERHRARGPSGASGPREVEHGTLMLEDVERAPPPPAGVGEGLRALREGARSRLARIAHEPTRGLSIALVLGDRSALSAEVTDLFTRTGTRHLLALSGLHVGLFAWLVLVPLARLAARGAAGLAAAFPGRRAGPRPRIALPAGEALLAAGLLLACVPLGGAGAPVRRAAIAGAVALAAPSLPAQGSRGARVGRRVDGLSLWSLALALEVLARPGATFELGVQQSYGATLALIALLPAVLRGRRRARAARPRLVQPLGWGAALAGRLGHAAVTGFDTSWIAVLGTLPFTWWSIGELAPAGCLATPLALPPLALLLAGGAGHALAPGLVPELALVLPARALLGLLRWVDALPATPCNLPPRPFALLALVALGLAWGIRRGDARGLRAGLGGLGLCLLPWRPAPAALEVVACDVGHGTAVAARAPGAGAWLFDAGSRDRGGVATQAVAPLLRQWDVGTLGVVLSHPDRDHAAGLAWLLQRYEPHTRAGAELPGGSRESALDLAQGRAVVSRRAGLSVELVRGQEGEDNEGSRHLALAWEGRRVLLLGDAEDEGLARSLAEGALDGPVDLLLLPHHGRSTPQLARLLERARPSTVWASCGEPPQVQEEVGAAGIALRSTFEDGPLRACFAPRRAGFPAPSEATAAGPGRFGWP